MISAQISLYPIEATDADAVINSSLQELQFQDLDFSVGPMSTEIKGDTDEVFQAIRRLFDRACSTAGEVSLVITISNSEL